MSIPGPFPTPDLKPPYYAVIFSTIRRADPPPPSSADAPSESAPPYDEMAARMLELVTSQPGYLGVESLTAEVAREGEGEGKNDAARSSEQAGPNAALTPVLSGPAAASAPSSASPKEAAAAAGTAATNTEARGITVSYWRSLEDIRHWKRNAEHLEAQRRGRTEWYSRFELRVAKVERAYAM